MPARFVLRKLLGLGLTLFAASLVIFAVLEVLPGDPALVMLGTEARPDTLAALRAEMGLDRPAHVRYLAWVGGMLAGDFGTSHTYARPVAGLIVERLAVTLPLALLALTLAVLIALPLGLYAARRHDRPAARAVMALCQLGLAIPGFWFGILLILVFAVWLGWAQAGGFPGWAAGPGPALAALLLPALALALPEAAILARVTRAALLETMGEDFVRTARAKGIGAATVMRRHVMPVALGPVLTIMGLQAGFLMAGAVVVENVFTLPGLGRLAFQAVAQRDVPVIEAVVMLLSAVVVAINVAVDILHGLLDPRPRAGGIA